MGGDLGRNICPSRHPFLLQMRLDGRGRITYHNELFVELSLAVAIMFSNSIGGRMNKVYLSIAVLILIAVLGSKGLAQGPQAESTFVYDPATRLFRWLVAGGEPLLRGGLPDEQAFRNFIASERFRQAMLQGLKLSEEQVRLVREAVTAGRFRVESIQPNTYTALFARMVNGDNQNPNGFTVKDIVMWAGSGPIESYVIDIPGLRLAIPKSCANVAIKPVVVNTIIRETRVEVPVEKIVEKIVEVPVSSPPSPPPNWCESQWTWYPLLTYPATPDRKRGFIGSDLRVGRDSLEAWLEVPGHPDPKLMVIADSIRRGVVGRILQEVPELRDKKVKMLHLDYDVCNDRMKVLWVADKFHWKEFILGNLTGLPIGFGLGWWLKESGTVPSLPGLLTKAPFFNPGPQVRPTTFEGNRAVLEAIKARRQLVLVR